MPHVNRVTEVTSSDDRRPQDMTVINDFNGVKVFSATMAQEREHLGEKVTDWIRSRPDGPLRSSTAIIPTRISGCKGRSGQGAGLGFWP